MKHLEDIECKKLVVRLDKVAKVEFSHLAQSTFTKSRAVKMRNKSLGVRPGIPDYLIVRPARYTGEKYDEIIFIEMKKEKGGKATDYQKKRINLLNDSIGVSAYICHGCGEAIRLLQTHTIPTYHGIFPKIE